MLWQGEWISRRLLFLSLEKINTNHLVFKVLSLAGRSRATRWYLRKLTWNALSHSPSTDANHKQRDHLVKKKASDLTLLDSTRLEMVVCGGGRVNYFCFFIYLSINLYRWNKGRRINRNFWLNWNYFNSFLMVMAHAARLPLRGPQIASE